MLLAGLCALPAARAVEPAATPWHFEDWKAEYGARATLGAAWREEDPDPRLIGKSNLNPALCATDNCLSVNPALTQPNQRWLQAPGAQNSLYDEGDLNYKRGDLVSAPAKLTGFFRANRDHLKFEVAALGFYDFANATLRENHPDEVVSPMGQGVPVYSRRDHKIIEDVGYNVQLLDAYVQDTFHYEGIPIDVSFGRQRMLWGEASFVTQGSLNFLNPPDANNLVRPGMDLDEVYKPEGMVIVRAPLSEDLNVEGFYQFEWRPVGIPARGSFMSFFNGGNEVTHDEGVVAPFAKAPYDPHQIGVAANPLLALVSNTSLTLRRSANHTPTAMDQVGFAAYWRPDSLDGSELGFYFANYHARIPMVSAYASDASCTRREGNPAGIDAIDLTSFIAACGVPGTHLRDAVPLDTAHYFLDYPENIQVFGMSVSTVFEGLAVRGEMAFRPNQPVQVDLEDVLFSALQPSFPRQDIPLFSAANTLPGLISAIQDPSNGLSTLANATGNFPAVLGALQTLAATPGVVGTTIPGSRTAIPDYLTAYRGGTPGEVRPRQYVRGYDRRPVLQSSLGLTKFTGDQHLLGTEDAALLLELTSIWVPGLPSLSQLQFEGPGTDTAAGPGVADTGNALHINPVQNRGGYVTEFSWGYRLGAVLHYHDVLLPGLDVRPFLVFTHDVNGVSPGLGENFLQGRKLGVVDVRFSYGSCDLSLTQTFFAGGGDHNTLRDRDFFAASLGMRFYGDGHT